MTIDTEKYKRLLGDTLDQVIGDLADIGVHNPDNPDDWVAVPEGVDVGEADPNVGADRVEEWDERAATLAQLETQYNNVRRALGKIDNGTYGTCEVCGEAIEADRLDANPAARTCKAHLEKESELPLSLQ